ncbi:heme ABC exporter ATP-binding protein CcmA [Kordiimonas laminariae]|uniref:heme ABC exporter ATP-binding protein CcmA n=1 Tax=Kordiimonas laminariae TaxID=2917717 RepID=UPI001FF3A73F|nr:heme ABC exporter ATP-binding protein CcmA [Kordiimonas laminariae]MCK0070000.1 heme ABC exporter ATP-binding protein CcmA [Kordiimonas laminariae]
MSRVQNNSDETHVYRGDNLSCWRGGRMVFEGLSFEVKAGEYLHLKGANGSGKSTLIRLLAGLLETRTGSASFAGDSMLGSDVAASAHVIYSGHQHALKPVLTLRENSENYVKLMTGGSLAYETLEAAVDRFDLYDLIDTPVRYFSSGQTHRCSLLRFCLLDRPIWLMDEPTVGLDAENRGRLEAVMQDHLNGGGIILAASHDPLNLGGKTLMMADFEAKASGQEYWL